MRGDVRLTVRQRKVKQNSHGLVTDRDGRGEKQTVAGVEPVEGAPDTNLIHWAIGSAAPFHLRLDRAQRKQATLPLRAQLPLVALGAHLFEAIDVEALHDRLPAPAAELEERDDLMTVLLRSFTVGLLEISRSPLPKRAAQIN